MPKSALIDTTIKHDPDCSGVLDAQLRQAIAAKWPSENGITEIPYSFSTIPYLSKYFGTFLGDYFFGGITPQSPNEKYQPILQKRIKDALDNWSAASNGMIKFYEMHVVYPWSRGINFCFTPRDILIANNNNGYSYSFTDSDANLHSASIFLPNDEKFWNWPSTHDIYTIHHEIGHALGFTHLHEYKDIADILQNTTDSVFCSVMPYIDHISTDISHCKQDCDIPYAIHPGQLDKRMLDLSYKQNLINTQSYYYIYSYIIVVGSAALLCATTSLVQNSFTSFYSHLSRNKKSPLMTKKMAQILADSSVLTAMIYMEFPVFSIAMYAASTATQYLPSQVVNKLPTPVRLCLKNNSAIYSMNLINSFMQSPNILSWISNTTITMAASYFGSVVGEENGEAIGATIAEKVNNIISPENNDSLNSNNKCSAANSLELAPTKNPHLLFASKRKFENDIVIDIDEIPLENEKQVVAKNSHKYPCTPTCTIL